MMNHNNSLQGKRIVLGVTGGIAAYKSAEVVRLLKKAGADVQVMMSATAQAFITPLTLQTLSQNPVQHEALQQASSMAHIDLARWADLVLIAPATAHFIAKMAAGLADYRVAHMATRKIKKTTATLSLQLIRNPDILAQVANLHPRPWCVGFAAETDHVIDNAQQKLIDKRLDMIIANEVVLNKGFQVDDNACTVVTAQQVLSFPKTHKKQLAISLIECIVEHGVTKLK